MQYGNAVGKRFLESLTKGNWAPVHGREFHATQIPLGTGQHRYGPRTTPNPDCGHELADITPRPAELRKAAKGAVGERDSLILWRRKTGHPPEGMRVALGGIRERCGCEACHPVRPLLKPNEGQYSTPAVDLAGILPDAPKASNSAHECARLPLYAYRDAREKRPRPIG